MHATLPLGAPAPRSPCAQPGLQPRGEGRVQVPGGRQVQGAWPRMLCPPPAHPEPRGRRSALQLLCLEDVSCPLGPSGGSEPPTFCCGLLAGPVAQGPVRVTVTRGPVPGSPVSPPGLAPPVTSLPSLFPAHAPPDRAYPASRVPSAPLLPPQEPVCSACGGDQPVPSCPGQELPGSGSQADGPQTSEQRPEARSPRWPATTPSVPGSPWSPRCRGGLPVSSKAGGHLSPLTGSRALQRGHQTGRAEGREPGGGRGRGGLLDRAPGPRRPPARGAHTGTDLEAFALRVPGSRVRAGGQRPGEVSGRKKPLPKTA